MIDPERCQAPGCTNPTDRGICDDCDDWVSEQVAIMAEADTPHPYGACGDKVGECTHCSELRGDPNFEDEIP